jgi:alpha-tubulin suppressor-like RCC1 family protein
VYSWGNNNSGQCGNSHFSKIEDTPLQIRALQNICKICVGDFHCAALTNDGRLYTWGCGSEGQLGHGNRSNQSTPRLLEGIEDVKSVACGGGHTGIITNSGQLYMFGRGRDG